MNPRDVLQSIVRRVRPAPAIDTRAHTGSPFTLEEALDADAADALARELAAQGIRLFPHPFQTAIAIVSDVDGSERADYEAYIGQIVWRYGLDFGDSCRLYERTPLDAERAEALAFFRCDGAEPAQAEPRRDTANSLGFAELLREFHRGNIDHMHGISSRGPRVVRLADVRVDGHACAVHVPEEVEAQRAGPFTHRAISLAVNRVAIAAPAPLGDDVCVRVRLRAGSELACRRLPAGRAAQGITVTGNAMTWFTLDGLGASVDQPVVGAVASIVIDGARDVREAWVLNNSPDTVASMLERLCGRWGFGTSLYTDHGSVLFVNAASEARHGPACAERAGRPPLPSLYSRFRTDALALSTLGDDPDSVCYLLPALRDRLGVRFMNPSGSSGEARDGMDVFDVIAPTRTRDGSSVYFARRCAIPLPDDADVDDRTRRNQGTRSFPHRLDRVLDLQPASGRRVWPVYTHLGNAKRDERPRGPYFPDATIARLQDRVMNVSGAVPETERIWMCRASTFYDYALMLRSLASHVTRDGDTIRIRSWHDDTLDQALPRSPEQLHGVTFDVDDAARAAVWLDDAPIDMLVRHAGAAAGRPCVTIAATAMRCVLEPGAQPMGCQYVGWRQQGPGSVGIVVETTTGGAFYFGDDIESESRRRCMAEAVVLPVAESSAWTQRVIPLYAMTWRPGARPGGPFPTQKIAQVRLARHGEIDVQDVEMLRPCTQPVPEFCVIGGQLLGHHAGASVRLSVNDRVREDALIDRRGFFAFAEVPTGASADVRAVARGRSFMPTRGSFVVRGHDLGLVIEID